jgi:sugar phosphate permease
MLVYGLMAPFAGGLLEMLSLRHVVLAALTSVAAGLLFAPFMHHSWQPILLWGGLVGTATGSTANVLAAVVTTRWFAAKRGLVIGFLTSAAGAGQFLFLPAIAELTTTYGWRRTSESLATAALLLVPVVARFMRDRPEAIGLHRYGEWSEDVQSGARPAAHNPLRYAFEVLADALRWREFWLICASLFISGVSTSGLTGTHLILASADHGIPESVATDLLAGIAIFNVIGSTTSGWISERLDPRLLLSALYILRGASLIFLPFAFNSLFGLSIFTVLYGLGWTATLPAAIRLAEKRFTGESAEIVLGWITAVYQIGGALSAYVAGIMRTDLGTYFQVFMLSGLLCFLASMLVLFIRREGSPTSAPSS